MKQNISVKWYVISLIYLFSSSPAVVMAGGEDGFDQMFKDFFGSESQKKNIESCGDEGEGMGFLGMVNSFFCHMEKDMGITGVGSATKSFGDFGVRAEVVTGVGSYDYDACIWVCNGSCTAAANYDRAMAISWTYNSSGSINKGEMTHEMGAFESGSDGGMYLLWDTGTATSSKTLSAKLYFSDGVQAFKMRADGSKSDTTLGITFIFDQGGTQMRMAASLDTSTDTGCVYAEGNGMSGPGTGSLNASATSDDHDADSECFTRTSAAGDWSYSGTGVSGSVPAFPAESANDISSYNTSGVLANGTTWSGCSVNPTSI